MFIGILQFELLIRWSESLKDKRRVVKSLKDRLHREHMVSVAEIGALDHHRIALMGVTLASNSARHASSVLDAVVSKLRDLRDAELGETRRQVLHAAQAPDEDWETDLAPDDGGVYGEPDGAEARP